ncbi:MaoC family dehydratase [Minwuia sp.]|uniref:MaoC family dehydratase n=1 Tax=Minwuia sp. TaxID=2493630 RepID=UPI003A8EF72C
MEVSETATDPERGSHTIADFTNLVGKEFGVSDWVTIDQERVTMFGVATEHRHWLHLDPERAVRDGPYGGTLAHGFLVTSLLSHFLDNVRMRPADAAFGLNYGFEKVRYLAPLVVGDDVRVRDRITILDATWRSGGRLMVKTGNRFEQEGKPDPVAYAEWMLLWVPMEKAS